MPEAHVLEAELRLGDPAEHAAPGAAVTVELCGHWEHEGACRWPHLTTVEGVTDGLLRIRVRYTAPTPDEPDVRAAITRALASGHLDGPDGPAVWTLISVTPGSIGPDDREWAARR